MHVAGTISTRTSRSWTLGIAITTSRAPPPATDRPDLELDLPCQTWSRISCTPVSYSFESPHTGQATYYGLYLMTIARLDTLRSAISIFEHHLHVFPSVSGYTTLPSSLGFTLYLNEIVEIGIAHGELSGRGRVHCAPE